MTGFAVVLAGLVCAGLVWLWRSEAQGRRDAESRAREAHVEARDLRQVIARVRERHTHTTAWLTSDTPVEVCRSCHEPAPCRTERLLNPDARPTVWRDPIVLPEVPR